MTRPLLAIGVGVWLATAALWPQISRADEEHERNIQVEEDDDGYEINQQDTYHNDHGDDEEVHVKERVDTNDDGYEVHRKIEREHEDDD